MNNRTIQRVQYLDILKCLGMFIVVSGHIHSHYGWLSLPIHAFVIPLYFLLSGLTFRSSKFETIGSFIKHRAQTLLLPYLLLSLVTWGYWAVMKVMTHDTSSIWFAFMQIFVAQGSGKFMVHNVPMWFVTCLFVTEYLYYYIDKLPKWANGLMLIVCAFIGTFMIVGPFSDILTKLPWSIESAFIALFFYGMGNLLTKTWSLTEIESLVLKRRFFYFVLMIILSAILVFSAHYNGHISLGSDLLGRSPFIFFVNAIIGIFAIGVFSIILSSINRTASVVKICMDYLLWFGRNSFFIMATHYPIFVGIVTCLTWITKKPVGFLVNDYFWFSVLFIITCACSSVAALLIGKLKEHDHKVWEKWMSPKIVS